MDSLLMSCHDEVAEKQSAESKNISGKEDGPTMQRLLNDILTDCSTNDQFQFSVTCQECGREWKSQPIAFSKAGIPPAAEGKKVIYAALYQREKEAAYQQAEKHAETHFSRCPICHRWVCDDCFMVCADLDMCRRCAKKLNEAIHLDHKDHRR